MLGADKQSADMEEAKAEAVNYSDFLSLAFSSCREQLVTLPEMLLKFFEAGYSMGHIHWGMVFAPPNPALGWATAPPEMEEIVKQHALYDMWSAELIR